MCFPCLITAVTPVTFSEKVRVIFTGSHAGYGDTAEYSISFMNGF